MRWKLFAAVVMSQLFLASNAFAGVCITDTLANYEGLGSTGCSIKALTFHDFTFAQGVSTGNPIPVDAGQITVSPIDPQLVAGFNFASGGFSVTAGQSIQYALTWAVDDLPPIHGFELDLNAHSPVFPGVVTIMSEECLGAAFTGATCPTGMVVTNTVFDNGITATLTDTEFFAPTSLIGERTIITLDATAGGSANFSDFTELAILTPEPEYGGLAASVLILLLVLRRIRLRQGSMEAGQISGDFGGLGSGDAGLRRRI